MLQSGNRGLPGPGGNGSATPPVTFYDDSQSIDVDMDEADQDSAAISQRCH